MSGDLLQVVRAADEFLANGEEWNALLTRCPHHHFSQSFAWSDAGWRIIGGPRGGELCCLTLRSNGRLVGVWPLVTYRERGRRVTRPLGAGASEYCIPLIEPDGDVERRTRLLWEGAARSCDLAILPYVPEESALSTVLRTAGIWRTTDFAAPALYAARSDYVDWAAYRKTLGRSLPHTLRRVGRRLAEQGKVTLGLEPADGRAAIIDWMLRHKTEWLDSQSMQSDWIGRSDYRDFLVDLAERSEDGAGLLLFVLKVDGNPVAANLVTVDRARCEVFIGVYDPDWRRFSPGQILTDHCLSWAFERNLDYDLRIGDAPYKRHWAPRTRDTNTWYVAVGVRGLPFVVDRARVVGWGKLRMALARLKRSLKPPESSPDA